MALTDQPLREISCDNKECNKTIVFDRRQEKEVFEANPWLKSVRLVQTVDQRNLVYCSDVCEIAGAKSGTRITFQCQRRSLKSVTRLR